MPPAANSPAHRGRDYVVAVLLVVLAFMVRRGFEPVLEGRLPFHGFYFPVAIMAWIGGFGPAVVSLLLGFAIGSWYFIEPRFDFGIHSVEYRISAGVYLVVGSALTGLGHLVRTKHRQLEAAIRVATSQKDLLATTVASLGDGIIVTDADGRIVLINGEAERLTGWKAAAAAGVSLQKVYRVLDPQTRRPLTNVHATGDDDATPPLRGDDAILVSKTGTETWISASVAPIQGSAEATGGFVLVLRNVTERRRATASLQESRQRLELALSAGRMGAWEWNLGTGEIYWSPGLEMIHGLAPGTFGGRFSDFKKDIHPDDVQLVLDRIQEAVDTGRDYHATYRIIPPDGAERWVEARGKATVSREGKTQKLGGVCMDVTDRRQAEDEIRKLNAELQRRVAEMERW